MAEERWLPVLRIPKSEYARFGIVRIDSTAFACLDYGEARESREPVESPTHLFTVCLTRDAEREMETDGTQRVRYASGGRVFVGDALLHPTRKYCGSRAERALLVVGGLPTEEWISHAEARRLEPSGLVGLRELEMRLRAWGRGEYPELLSTLYDLGTFVESAAARIRRFLFE